MSTSDKKYRLWITLGIIFILAAIYTVFTVWNTGLGIMATTESLFRVGWPLLLILATIILTIYLAATKRGVALISIGGLAFLVTMGYAIGLHGYNISKKFEEGHTVSVDEPVNYADRAPWVVANNYAQRNQGDVIGERSAIHYVPAKKDADAADGEGTSRYTTLIRGKALFGLAGYEAIQALEMPTTGTIPKSAGSYCEMPDGMDSKLESFWPAHSLTWGIHAKKPFAHWKNEDAYAYCDDDNNPIVVVPLYAYEGFLVNIQVPDGAAVYTKDGLEILKPEELADKGIQGPSYPRSIAKSQRTSINAGGTLGDWWGYRFGYSLTDKDGDDTNTGNTSEFTLIKNDGQMDYVTPLTPRGTSQSITAVSTIPAQQTNGELAELKVNTSPDMGSTSTVATTIKESSVNGDNAWTTRWASGMAIYEILPAQDGHWAASIGQGQAVSYRADVTPDGVVTVTNSDTGASSAGDEGKKKPGDDDSVSIDTGKPLDQLSDEQLLETIKKATSELQKRQGDK